MRTSARVAFLAALGILLLLTTGLRATVAADVAAEPVVARITVRSPAELERLMALGLDLLEMRQGNDLFALISPAEVDQLRRRGWRIAVDHHHTATAQTQQATQRAAPAFAGGYRTVEEMRALLEGRAADYSALAEFFVYGQSWEMVQSGGAAGHELFGIRLTNRARSGPKPTFFLMAAIHARELTTSELALRFIDHLLAGYGVDGDATWLLDEHVIVVVPVANPDGRVLAEQGYLQRKNTDTSYGPQCSVPNIGVDLNRNAPFKWGTVDPPTLNVCSLTYPGPVAASEPETTGLMEVVRSLFPDQRGPGDTDAAPPDTTGILITLHSYSELVMWPWGWTSGAAPNAAGLSAIGRTMAAYNGYTPQQSIKLYPTSGTTDDWAYGELGIAAFTFEVGPGSGACGGFFPPFRCLDDDGAGGLWARNLPAFLYAARIARAPYQLAQGPTPDSAMAIRLTGDRVELRARFAVPAGSSGRIAAAEYYVDTPPWQGGTPIPMAPLDGGFSGSSEVARAVAGPFTDRRLFYLRAQDANGVWGPVRAAFTSPADCEFDLSPTVQAFPPPAAAGSITVTAPDGCAWLAQSNASWIALTAGDSGLGNGTLTYSVSASGTATPRAGTIAVGGQVLTVTQQGPDLVIENVSNPPLVVAPGGRFSVSDTVRNVAPVAAPSSMTSYYLGRGPSWSSGDTLLGGTRKVSGLGAGSSSTGSINVSVPATIAVGEYYLIACADDRKVVSEAGETNNCRASTQTLQVPRADLVTTTVGDPPSTALRGGQFTVTDTVKNVGGAASGQSTTRFYLAMNPSRGPGDVLLSGNRTVAGLATGASSTGTINVKVPSGAASRTYYLLACADDRQSVAEADEGNNCAAAARRLTIGP